MKYPAMADLLLNKERKTKFLNHLDVFANIFGTNKKSDQKLQ